MVAVTICTAIIHYKQVLGYLPREVAGLWLLFWGFGSYLAFFDLGMGPTLSREISFLARETDNTVRQKAVVDLVATCFRIYVVIAVAVFLSALLLGLVFLKTLKFAELTPRDATLAWSLFSAGACINLIGNISYAVLTGEGHVAVERLTRAISMLLWLGLSALALVTGYGLIGLASAWLMHACISRLVAVATAKYFVENLKLLDGRWSSGTARRLARPSAQWALTQLGALMILQTDNALIAWNLGTAAIPSYEAAAKVVTAMGTIALLRTNASTPYYSRAAVAGDTALLRKLLFENVRQGLLVMATAITFLAFFAPIIFTLWLGPGNFVGYPILFIFLAMMTLEIHHVSHATLTMATGSIPFVRSALIAGVLNLGFSYTLLQWLGLPGVALGTLLAQIATNNWYAPYVTLKTVDIRVSSYLLQIGPRFAVLLLAFGAIQGLTWLAVRNHDARLQLSAGIISAIFLYCFSAKYLKNMAGRSGIA